MQERAQFAHRLGLGWGSAYFGLGLLDNRLGGLAAAHRALVFPSGRAVGGRRAKPGSLAAALGFPNGPSLATNPSGSRPATVAAHAKYRSFWTYAPALVRGRSAVGTTAPEPPAARVGGLSGEASNAKSTLTPDIPAN